MKTNTPAATPSGQGTDATRRRWLQFAAAAPILAAGGPSAAQPLKTKARIVIAGSGLGGLAVAYRLSKLLDGAQITIVDRKAEHNYQPGYTLVATGVWPMEQVRARNADLQPAGVEWVRDMAAGFDPVAKVVTTASGQRVPYDFLVVATGVHLDYAEIEGMDVALIGKDGLGSVYASPQAAQSTWSAMQAFAQKGGQALMTLPATPLKCAGAPLKMTFMLRDRLREAGTLGQSQVRFVSALGNVFGVKAVNDNVLARWRDLGIEVEYTSKLVAVDPGARRATFASPEGERVQLPYDFLHVVPPMRAPDAVKRSDLAWKDGPFAACGWL
jgi:sulfide:quinone oxidoreductase